MDNDIAINAAEAILRVILGWRFLVSGVSNVRRWPNPVRTASLVFPRAAAFFGAAATFLMLAGGLGLALGLLTRTSAAMLIVFLLPTFAVHQHWLQALPALGSRVADVLGDRQTRETFHTFQRQAYHAHEVGIRDNLVLLAAAIYFAVRGGGRFALDNWLGSGLGPF